MPRLYNSLLEFQNLFEQLARFRLNFPDDPYNTYKQKRKESLERTIGYLFSTIQEVVESMSKLNVTLPDKKKTTLPYLNLDVDLTECFQNDYLAFRAYGNMLHSYFLEFRCKGKKYETKKICKNYFDKLQKKKESKNQSSTKRP